MRGLITKISALSMHSKLEYDELIITRIYKKKVTNLTASYTLTSEKIGYEKKVQIKFVFTLFCKKFTILSRADGSTIDDRFLRIHAIDVIAITVIRCDRIQARIGDGHSGVIICVD